MYRSNLFSLKCHLFLYFWPRSL